MVMSAGKVVPPPHTFFPHHAAHSPHTAPLIRDSQMPLTPPDSPSSDDEDKKPGTSVRKTDSESNGDEGDCAPEGHVGGVLIEPRASEGSHPPTRVPSGRGKEGANTSRSVSAVKDECRHEGGSGASDHRCVRVMQQKGGAPPPMTTLSDQQPPATPSMGCPPLRSVLKRSGQRSRGHRVCINESKNEVVEADYVILVRDEDEPQLVSIRTFDLGLNASSVDQVTLSPPEGYKDVFGHAVHETIEDSDTENGGVDLTSNWGYKVHDPDCPRANLPDVVSHQQQPRCQAPTLTVENVRHHDQLMEDNQTETEGDDGKVAKTGILKGGKLWKNGAEARRPHQRIEEERSESRVDEPRRSVRFSGRDEYTTLEAAEAFDKIPFSISNETALACFLSPKFRELSALLGEHEEEWQVELSPASTENCGTDLEGVNSCGEVHHHVTCVKHSQKVNDHRMDDEHISESVQRYEEMRRRIAIAEGRDNTSVCSDESKSSSDSQSSDSTTTETKIRRLENSDVAHVAGGVMRSNSEVRRAIERNALRRSLIRFAEARKKDTNKNEKNEKQESSLIEKLKWLTASEDATNGNAEDKISQTDAQESSKSNQVIEEEKSKPTENSINCTIGQYRKLAEMFNRTTSIRGGDINVPGDVREWKLESDLFPCENILAELDIDDLPPGTHTFTAVPAVSVCEQISDEETDKLIYSGGIRYTKEGTLPPEEDPRTKNGLTVVRDRSVHPSKGDSYSAEDIDEVLHDDRSSSVPSSSQSSPRLSGRSDVDGTSTAESGYSSNETNSDLGHMLPPELDELAEFVRQDAGRMDRLRKRYDESEDHGFCRRPSVRGIKPRFGSTTDLLKQMANQLIPHNVSQPSSAGSHMTWPYRDAGDEENGRNSHQRRRLNTTRNNPLPALQEDIPYTTASDGMCSHPPNNQLLSSSSGGDKPLRVVHAYSSTGDLRAPGPSRSSADLHDIRPVGQMPPQRAQSYTSLPQANQYAMTGSHHGTISQNGLHHPSCASRRPASVHGHAPTDMLVSGPQHPTPSISRSCHTLPHHSLPLSPYQSYEDPGQGMQENSHMPLGSRGSYPGTGQYIPPNVIHDHHNNVPTTYQHSPHISQASPLECQPSIGHQTSSNSQTLSSGPAYDRDYCPVWHSSNSNPSLVHSPHTIPPPIVSSQMSYTTPIVPETLNSRSLGQNMVNGMIMKMEMERGVPEGASSSRVIMDSHYPISHHPPPRDSGLIHHHPQTMNVST